MAKKKTFDPITVEEYAYKGFKNRDIADALGVSTSFIYDNKEFLACIKKGRQRLRQELTDAMLSKATDHEDTTMQIFLAKRLGLFEKDTPQVDLKSSEDSMKAFEKIFNADIPLEAKNALKGILESFNRGHEILELEKRIIDIEKSLEKK